MPLNRRSLLIAAPLLATPGLVFGQALPEYKPNFRRLRVGTATTGGNYHWAVVEPRVGFQSTLDGLFPEGVQAVPSNGSRDNVDRLLAGDLDMAFVQEDVLVDATKAKPELRREMPVFRVSHPEVLHIIAGQANKWSDLDTFAKAGGELGVGRAGGGTAETWRILTEVSEDAKKFFQKINPAIVGADYNRFVEVRDTRGTAQAMIEGPGSDNSTVANEVSVGHGKPELIMLNIDDKRWSALKRLDGEALYKTYQLAPKAAVQRNGSNPGSPGFYDHLLPAGGWISSGGISTIGTRALLVVRGAYRAGMPSDQGTRVGRAIDQTLVALRKRTNPFNVEV
jgi:hypothetical protein